MPLYRVTRREQYAVSAEVVYYVEHALNAQLRDDYGDPIEVRELVRSREGEGETLSVEQVPSRLRDARLAAGLTLNELAALASVGRATIERIEHAQVRPRPDTRVRLARALALSVSDLFPPCEGDHPIRVRRLALGLTQGALARLARVDESTVQRVERGEHLPLPPVRRRLLAALGLTMDERARMFPPLERSTEDTP